MKNRIMLRMVIFCLSVCCISATAAAYSDAGLCDMARRYFEDTTGYPAPQYIQVDGEKNGIVTIHLYDFGGNMTFTSAWYYVDRNTGKGTDLFDNAVDLSPYASNAPAGSGLPFQDVRTGDWYYDSVRYVYENSLFSGTSATTFSPESSMNRAMLVTVLYRMEGQPSVYQFGCEFRDVPSGSYYRDAVTWASSRGVVTGTSSQPAVFDNASSYKTVSPQNPITQEQLAVILYRYAVLFKGMDAAPTADLRGYPNGGQVANYAAKAVAWCISNGVIRGDSLTPKRNATRAEVADMLYRLDQLPKAENTGYRQILEPLAAQRVDGSSVMVRSMYYDMNQDGVEELFTLYEKPDGEVRAAIYAMCDGQAVSVLDEHGIALASAPVANFGFLTRDGQPYVCLQSENGGTTDGVQIRGGICKLYSVSNSELTLAEEIEYGDPSPYENEFKPGMNYKQFQTWLKSVTWKACISFLN